MKLKEQGWRRRERRRERTARQNRRTEEMNNLESNRSWRPMRVLADGGCLGSVLVWTLAIGALAYLAESHVWAEQPPKPQEQVLSPSVLNANPEAFDGKTVLVRAYVTLAPGGHTLYESKALDLEFRRRMDDEADQAFNPKAYEPYCLTIANPQFLNDHMDAFNGRTIEVHGQFMAHYLDAQHIDMGACPLPTGLLVDIDDLKRRYRVQ